MFVIKVMDVTSPTMGVIAHGVNCQYRMASGVAKVVRHKWPNVYQEYMAKTGGAQNLGKAHIIPVGTNLYVANVYTQDRYGYDGQPYASLPAIERGITQVAEFAANNNLNVFMPRIGCGLGGLSWADVSQVLQRVAVEFSDIDIIVCDLEPQENPNELINY